MIKSHSLILQIDSTFTLESYKFILLLISFFSSKLLFIKFLKTELVLFVSRKDLFSFLLALKSSQYTQYKFLVDIFGVDNIKYNKLWRFEVVYHLLSICYTSRIFIKTNLNEFSFVESTVPLFKGSSWYEREVWDMFGIFFTGHNDLRRILTDYGFNGYPLRKDYPLTGFYELRYSDQRATVLYESITLTQEYRYFNFLSPWNI